MKSQPFILYAYCFDINFINLKYLLARVYLEHPNVEAAASPEERVGDGEAPEVLAEVRLNFLMSLLPMVGNRNDDIEFVRRVFTY